MTLRSFRSLLIASTLAAVLAGALAVQARAAAPLAQPFWAQPFGTNHWLMSTFELVKYGNDQKFHAGFDIVGAPYLGSLPGDDAVAVTDGSVCFFNTVTPIDDNVEKRLRYETSSGTAFAFEHLDPAQVDPCFDAMGVSCPKTCSEEICAGDTIAGLALRHTYAVPRVPHLHFAYSRGNCDYDTEYLDPTSLFDPFSDTQTPVIDEAWLCDDDSATFLSSGWTGTMEWQNCEEISPWTCPTIQGRRDIVALVRDRHHAAGATDRALGLKKLEWCVSAGTGTSCPWNAAFDFGAHGLITDWTAVLPIEATEALYSFHGDFVSSTEEDKLGQDVFWMIATNGDSNGDGNPDAENHADLTSVSAHAKIKIRATDFSDQEATLTTYFCKLTGPVLFNCTADYDFVDPDTCKLWTRGPEIFFKIPLEVLNPDPLPRPDLPWPIPFPVEAGTELPVTVCMTARGPQGMPLDERVSIRLYAGTTLPAVSDAEGRLEMTRKHVASEVFKPEELLDRNGRRPSGLWMPGGERCATLTMSAPVRFASLDALDGLNLYALVETRSSPVSASTNVALDPQKSGRSLRRLFEEANGESRRGDPPRKALERTTD